MRKLGIECYSCDIEQPSGGHPEWHILGDVIPYINGNCSFTTMDNQLHIIEGQWDLLIAHPPCTYLTISGNRWFDIERYGEKAIQRMKNREDAAEFFMNFINAKCEHIAVENPIGYMNTHYRKPDQIIHPYQFGEPTKKGTCLWLKGLPLLQPTKIVEPEFVKYQNGKKDSLWHYNTVSLPAKLRAKERSRTFQVIAEAIANQWGNYILNI